MPPLRLRKTFRMRYIMKDTLFAQVRNYIPANAQEEADQALLLHWLECEDDISVRTNLTAHLTASAWVVTPDRNRVLMAYHKLYDSWAWLGGHADGDWNLRRVAETEAREESGIRNLTLLSENPVSLEILTVSGHEKKGAYVPSHLHLNLTYLFEADPSESLQCKPDENSGVAWVDMASLDRICNEPWFVERIYSKLILKARNL